MADELVPLDQAADVLLHGGTMKIADPEEVSRGIAERVLNAPDVATVLASQETTAAADVVGKPLNITGVSFMASTFAEGPGVYAVVTAADTDTGEVLTITSGGRTVLAQLIRMAQLEAFPTRAKFVQATKPTANGFYPFWLAAA